MPTKKAAAKKTSQKSNPVVATAEVASVKVHSQKARFTDGKKNTLAVTMGPVEKPAKGEPVRGSYRVSVSHKTAATNKRLRGMISEFPTRDEAIAKFDEIVLMATRANWSPAMKSTRVQFDTLPLAE
jgi:hypothetical protein